MPRQFLVSAGGDLVAAAPLRQLLRRNFKTPVDAMAATNLERSLVERVWSGKKPYVTLDTADKACIALGKHLDEIYPFEENEET